MKPPVDQRAGSTCRCVCVFPCWLKLTFIECSSASSTYLSLTIRTLCRSARWSSEMDPRPDVKRGDYFRTRPRYSRIRCKGYTAPPWDGLYCGTLSPSFTFGPVETWIHGDKFTTVLVNGWWINVWTHKRHECGQKFATKIPPWEVLQWHQRGWQDVYQHD